VITQEEAAQVLSEIEAALADIVAAVRAEKAEGAG
jgi:hypothetical protein